MQIPCLEGKNWSYFKKKRFSLFSGVFVARRQWFERAQIHSFTERFRNNYPKIEYYPLEIEYEQGYLPKFIQGSYHELLESGFALTGRFFLSYYVIKITISPPIWW